MEMDAAEPQTALRAVALGGALAGHIARRNALAGLFLWGLFLFAHGASSKTGQSWLPGMIAQGMRSTTPTLSTPLHAR
jgi:hypothetical protein